MQKSINNPLLALSHIKASDFESRAQYQIFMAYAQYAGNNTLSCWPSHETIAETAGYCLSYVLRIKQQLIASGWIRSDKRDKKGFSLTSLVTLSKDKINAVLQRLGRGLLNITKGSTGKTQNYLLKNNYSNKYRKSQNITTRDSSLEQDLTDRSWAPDEKPTSRDQGLIETRKLMGLFK